MLDHFISRKVCGSGLVVCREPDLPVYVCGVGQYGEGGRQVDGNDDPGSGEDLVVGVGGGGQSGDGH